VLLLLVLHVRQALLEQLVHMGGIGTRQAAARMDAHVVDIVAGSLGGHYSGLHQVPEAPHIGVHILGVDDNLLVVKCDIPDAPTLLQGVLLSHVGVIIDAQHRDASVVGSVVLREILDGNGRLVNMEKSVYCRLNPHQVRFGFREGPAELHRWFH